MNKHVMADEAGNLDFRPEAMASGRASRFFILTTVTMTDLATPTDRLMQLRRDLAAEGVQLPAGYFHAKDDRQFVRDRVFEIIRTTDLRVDATVYNKASAYAYLQQDELRFYKTAWFFHFRWVAPRIIRPDDNVLIVAATLGFKRKAHAIRLAVDDVAAQVVPVRAVYHVGSWSAESDAGLQIADYCSWAVQRRWERGDDRSHRLIQTKIGTEYPMWGAQLPVARSEEMAG